MGSAYSFLIALLCVACSRESEDVYSDPYADPDVKVGQNVSGQIESADQHDGRHSAQTYEFKGKCPANKMSAVKKYDDECAGDYPH